MIIRRYSLITKDAKVRNFYEAISSVSFVVYETF